MFGFLSTLIQDISLIIALIGAVATVIFQISLTFGDYSVRQQQPVRIESDVETMPYINIQRKNFLKIPEMYQNTLLYVYSRVLITIASVYIPLWLNEHTGVELVAIVPMISYIVSFVSSLPMDKTIRCFGHKVTYLSGVLIFIVGCILVEISSNFESPRVIFFATACLFGAGSSITMICSLCLIADMIADHTEQSGYVYAVVTTADKLIAGILIMAIQMQ